jgi:hypothetical protein
MTIMKRSLLRTPRQPNKSLTQTRRLLMRLRNLDFSKRKRRRLLRLRKSVSKKNVSDKSKKRLLRNRDKKRSTTDKKRKD